jgi:hypothetical protein
VSAHSRLAAAAAAAALLPAIGATDAAAAPASPRACAGWVVRPSPTTGDATLVNAAATGPHDVWAVGRYFSNGMFKTLIEHWGGRRWRIVPSPNPAAGAHAENLFNAVVALSAKNAWAFGEYGKTSASLRTLVEHWNGTRWSVVPSPNAGTGGSTLADAVARSATSIWAVGIRGTPPHQRTLTEHWNGRRWRIVPSPNTGAGENFLFGVASAARGPVWAVGAGDLPPGRALALRWTGRSWVVSRTADPGDRLRFLDGVAAPQARYALAVGSYFQGAHARVLAERWTGSGWSIVPAASPGDDNFLGDVAARGTRNAWAVGGQRASLGSAERTLTEHWNGTAWTVAASPSPRAGDNELAGVTAVPGGGIWAVGFADDKTLTEFRC